MKLNYDQLQNRKAIALYHLSRVEEALREIEESIDNPDDIYGDEINTKQVMSALQDIHWCVLSVQCLNFGTLIQ